MLTLLLFLTLLGQHCCRSLALIHGSFKRLNWRYNRGTTSQAASTIWWTSGIIVVLITAGNVNGLIAWLWSLRCSANLLLVLGVQTLHYIVHDAVVGRLWLV